MQGTVPGARRRGRPSTAWMDNIKTWTGLSVEESVRMTEDRDKWRKYVHGVANARIEDGLRTGTEQLVALHAWMSAAVDYTMKSQCSEVRSLSSSSSTFIDYSSIRPWRKRSSRHTANSLNMTWTMRTSDRRHHYVL